MQSIQHYFKDKTIWITGASSGIGASLAQYLDNKTQCKLILSGRNRNKLYSVAKNFKRRPIFSIFDITNKQQLVSEVSKINSQCKSIDILILNAGDCQYVTPNEFNSEVYHNMMDTNFFSIINMLESLLPNLLSQQSAHIVTISSLAALVGFPRSSAYGASKAALENFTHCLQLDLANTSISVTSILPGFVKTPLTDRNDFNMVSVVSSDFAAKKIALAISKKSKEYYFPFWFSLFIRTLSFLPLSFRYIILRRITQK